MSTKRHTVEFQWTHYGEIEAVIRCPFDPADPERPCSMWEHPETRSGLIEGCGVEEWLDAAGFDGVTVEDVIKSVPVPFEIVDFDDNGPTIGLEDGE